MKPQNKNRNKAYARHQRKRIIQRKKLIAAQRDWLVKIEGRFAKGKVHCSCAMCSEKTKQHGYPKSQLIKMINCHEQLFDYDY
ncbi:hypothetical protein NQ117_21130 [Paenibacillus sp. SC116]|uniref:hypothetical protein n=1 Tax=Paenibacillus sp. SC116 TaxID=2968986 RepID=UPI00215A6231|nr:hypothetical protein [Paenibacillus sp. SC116]MCR8846191.1 hypothetical protein [Paenibacillus sp. SC116]